MEVRPAGANPCVIGERINNDNDKEDSDKNNDNLNAVLVQYIDYIMYSFLMQTLVYHGPR